MVEARPTVSVGTWASLPLDLLLVIFRRLESTAVIRCAASCKPWRRAIIGNASFLRPCPDRFLPRLLLGVYHDLSYCGRQDSNGDYTWDDLGLRRIAGPHQSVLPSKLTKDQSFIVEDYNDVLSSRDGFILLSGRRSMTGLCLYNRMTGDCTFFPKAKIEGDDDPDQYILLTGFDFSVPGSGNDLAVQILAVTVDGSNGQYTEENKLTYQLASDSGGSGVGVWGPIRRSMELPQGFRVMAMEYSTAVCRDVVHWLGCSTENDWQLIGTVALDVHTGRTWITELHEKFYVDYASSTLLATTGDGRLSLIRSLTGHQIQVWALNGGDQWSLQQTIEVQKQLPHCREDNLARTPILFEKKARTLINSFCPRSGCVLATFADQEIRIDIESGSRQHVECIGKSMGSRCRPYEMDWSTYISKMKFF